MRGPSVAFSVFELNILMKRSLFLAVWCTLAIFSSACKRTLEVPDIENVNESITLQSVRAQPDKVVLKFIHRGDWSNSKVGIVHASDSVSLLSKINDGVQEELVPGKDSIYTYTFERNSSESTVYYSFCISWNGTKYYSPIHESSYGFFKFLEFGFSEDDVLASTLAPDVDFDFFFFITTPFQDYANLEIYLDDEKLPYRLGTGIPPAVNVRLPEPVKSGHYRLRMVYKDKVILYKNFFIPRGRLRLATRHPGEPTAAFGHYIYGSKIYRTILRADLQHLEYSSWDPATNTWKTSYETVDYSFYPDIFNSVLSDNIGVQVGDKIFFQPGGEFEDAEDTTYYLQTITELDPVRYTWKKHIIRKIPIDNSIYYSEWQVDNMQLYQNKLYVLQHGYNGMSPDEGFQVCTYSPETNLYEKVNSLPLRRETKSAQLLMDGDVFYIVSFSEFRNPLKQWDYETRIYRTDATFQSLELILELPTEVFGGLSILLDRKIYVFNGYREYPLAYKTRPFGLEYDIKSDKYEYINPTYSSFGITTHQAFLFAINNMVFNGNELGEIVEWEIHYGE